MSAVRRRGGDLQRSCGEHGGDEFPGIAIRDGLARSDDGYPVGALGVREHCELLVCLPFQLLVGQGDEMVGPGPCGDETLSDCLGCSDASNFYNTGMCDVLPRISPSNVVIVYSQTGLGFADRPGGPAPTITVSLQNLSLQLLFLGGLLGLNELQMPAMITSITAEDMSSQAPSF